MSDNRLRVWIDQDLCTGSGLCEYTAPEIFQTRDDGLPYTIGELEHEPCSDYPSGLAIVPIHLTDQVIEAEEECPGECIFIECP